MKTKFLTIAITCFLATFVFAQANINNYKYVIVPNKYDFLSENNQYQLNGLTKFLFEKYGFETVMEGSDYPSELSKNRCLALNSDVIKGTGMFKTKLEVKLTDCNDKVIYTSQVGESREKEFKTAYTLALREAFKSIEALNYKYIQNQSFLNKEKPVVKTENTQEIQQLKKEIEYLKQTKEAKVAPVTQKITTQNPVNKTVIQSTSNVLYAQAIDNGFQLVDSAPKVVYRIKTTNLKNIYLVEGSSALVYKKDTDWIIEYYSGGTLNQETLNIKF